MSVQVIPAVLLLPLKVKHKSHKTQNKQKKKQTQNGKLLFKTLMMLGIVCRRC